MINGESGTGKELVAKAIHDYGKRRGGPFIAVNMAAIPRELVESELFGHEKGAFTGANARKVGRFEQAEGGTLFLDEIGDMPSELQTRLLRVLSEGVFHRLGGSTPRKVDVRIIAATHQDLEARVQQGEFREDLFHRLNVVRLPVPALRERHEDVPLLARHFMAQAAQELGIPRKRLSEEVEQRLTDLDWPGNVRELENAIERAVVLSRNRMIGAEDLPETISAPEGARAVNGTPHGAGGQIVVPALADGWTPTPLNDALREPERQIILAALNANDWNRNATADQLQINRTTLYKKIKQYRLDEPD
jgi:two-component system nitrogen regulation response regulator GlnG